MRTNGSGSQKYLLSNSSRKGEDHSFYRLYTPRHTKNPSRYKCHWDGGYKGILRGRQLGVLLGQVKKLFPKVPIKRCIYFKLPPIFFNYTFSYTLHLPFCPRVYVTSLEFRFFCVAHALGASVNNNVNCRRR